MLQRGLDTERASTKRNMVGNRSSNQRYECRLGIPRLQKRTIHRDTERDSTKMCRVSQALPDLQETKQRARSPRPYDDVGIV